MSPEQARSQEVGPPSDVYSLGCVTDKMLTGSLPFKGDNAMDLIIQQIKRPPPAPDKLAPSTPAKLSKLVVRMMAKEPAERPTLPELRETFTELRGKGGVIVAKPRRSKLPLLLAVLAVLATGGAFAVVMMSNRTSSTSAKETPPPAADKPAVATAPTPASADPGIEMDPTPAAKKPAPTPLPAPPPAPPVDKKGSAAPSPTPSGPIKSPTKKDPGPVTDPNEVAEQPAVPANKPGAILVELDQLSTITIDGKVVADGSKGGRFEVPPGHHELEARTPDHKPVTRSLDMEAGGTAIVNITFPTTSAP
jgi:serine/threonine-protein kinase